MELARGETSSRFKARRGGIRMELGRGGASSKWRFKVEVRSWKRRELEKEERGREGEERMELFKLLGWGEGAPPY